MATLRQVTRPNDAPQLPVVRGNAGVHAWYRQKLEKAVADMHQSFLHWLTAEYKAVGLAHDAADGGATRSLQDVLHVRGRQWQKTFDKLADSLSKRLAERVLLHSDTALASGLQAQGFMVKFTMSPAMKNAYQAVIGEQVGLIKSIASQHLTEVEGLVMRSVARGRDLGSLTAELKKRYGITQRRAAFIARDQSNKATTTLQAARQQDIGIAEGDWRHSHGGKHPRPEHLAADGKRFKLAEGMWMPKEGRHVMPGEDPNCRCGWTPVLPGFD